MPPRVLRRDADRCAAINCNIVRSSTIRSEAFLDACDELVSRVGGIPRLRIPSRRSLEELLVRHVKDIGRADRNHPAISFGKRVTSPQMTSGSTAHPAFGPITERFPPHFPAR